MMAIRGLHMARAPHRGRGGMVAAVGGFDMGQVLLVVPPYRVDMSLNLFAVGLVVLFIRALRADPRIARTVWRMPQRVAAYRARSRVAKAHASLRDAIGNLYAGRFSQRGKGRERRARERRQQGRGRPDRGANAAHRMHEYARRDEWLGQIDEARTGRTRV